MVERLRLLLLRWLRIPEGPQVPPGEESHAEVFRAGEGYYQYLLLQWGLRQVGAVAGLVAGAAFLHTALVLGRVPWGRARGVTRAVRAVPMEAFLVLEAVAWGLFLVACAGSFLLLVWNFRCRYYILTDRCLRIQQGLWTFREQTFSLANIQDLDVHRGPLQRFLGIGDLVVRTAGGGGGAEAERPGHGAASNLHEGRLRGVADPERLRDRLLERMRAHGRSGLGEPEAAPRAPALEAAARLALLEVRALREDLERRGAGSAQQG